MKHFKIMAWNMQLITGIVVFICSFYFEQAIIRHFISNDFIGIALTLALEMGKVGAIIWYALYKQKSIISNTFRVGLLVLSLICSVVYLVENLDKPNLQVVQNQALISLEKAYNERIVQVKSITLDAKNALILAQKREKDESNEYYSMELARLDKLVLMEMDNAGENGYFQGPRYRELKGSYINMKSEFGAKMHQLNTDHRQQLIDIDNKLAIQVNEITDKYYQDRKNTQNGSIDLGRNVNDSYMLAITDVLGYVGLRVEPIVFIVIFSMSISLLMEMCIILSFSALCIGNKPIELNEIQEHVIEVEQVPEIKNKIITLSKKAENRRIARLKQRPTLPYSCACKHGNRWLFSASRERLIDKGNVYVCEYCSSEIIKIN